MSQVSNANDISEAIRKAAEDRRSNVSYEAELSGLLRKIQDEKNSTFEMCKHLSQCDDEALGHCGFRNGQDNAIAETVRKSLKSIEKMTQAFEKRFPS